MRYIIILLLIVVQGCAQMIPARAWEIEPGIYKLEASGNVFASDESLHAKIDKKSAKKCGVSGFSYLDKSSPRWNKQTTYSNGVRVTASYKVLTKTIQCNDKKI